MRSEFNNNLLYSTYFSGIIDYNKTIYVLYILLLTIFSTNFETHYFVWQNLPTNSNL